MQPAWWKESVVYQIYPRSFFDSNGDGIGDLPGILCKLNDLQELGVNIIWLSPVYQSPNYDNGYDISDYFQIMSEFGTLADWERLLAAVHDRGMRLIMDLVVNHTSTEHIWFQKSRSSKDNPYRDYYIWRPGKEGREPNNWASEFGDSAWEFDETTGEYYLHLFSRWQPDLNWENKNVRNEVYAMMKWWLDKGIDGFRMDVINLISKAPGLPDAPAKSRSRYQLGRQFYQNGPLIQYYLREMHQKVLRHYDIMTVGETPGVDPEEATLYVSETRHELDMVFQFELLELDYGDNDKWNVMPWKLSDFKQILSEWQIKLQKENSWNSLFLNNHDQPRAVSRFGDDGRYRIESAKLLATLTHTLQGTPFIFQGEEIGMTNVAFTDIADYRDVDTLNFYRSALDAQTDPAQVMAAIHARSRDNARTPMQWDSTENAGFSKGKPWINVNPNYQDINVNLAKADPKSIWHYYRRLIRLRKDYPVLIYGSYRLLMPDDEQVYAYLRTLHQERCCILLNFSSKHAPFLIPEDVHYSTSQLLLSNYQDHDSPLTHDGMLKPYEARVYVLL